MELIPPFYSKVNTMIMQQQTNLLLQAHVVALPWPAACTTAYHHTYDGHPPTAVSIMDQYYCSKHQWEKLFIRNL